jgi:hypothetical protein
MHDAADRGSADAIKWVAEHSASTAVGGRLPGLDKLFVPAFQQFISGVPPTNSERNQKLESDYDKKPAGKNTSARAKICDKFVAPFYNAGIATFSGNGMPADPQAVLKIFHKIGSGCAGAAGNAPAIVALIDWLAAPGTAATYARLDECLQQYPRNDVPLRIQYECALVAYGRGDFIQERYLLSLNPT